MSKAVLISIRPKWCEKIASGEKTIEVRKNQPMLETPFKCYIYCTEEMAGYDALWVSDAASREKYSITAISAYLEKTEGASKGNRKVIGEFVCDNIFERIVRVGMTCMTPEYCLCDWNMDCTPIDGLLSDVCMTKGELEKYLDGGIGYGWHISDLKIYGTPKELNEFWAYNETLHKRYDAGTDFCCYDATDEYGDALTDCGDDYNDILKCYRCWNEWSKRCHHVERPPQNWCYVEEQG